MTLTVDKTGVNAPSLDEAKAAAEEEYANIFGSDIDEAAQAPQGQLAGVDAFKEAEVGEALVSLTGLFDVDRAGGSMQDLLYGLVDVRRRGALRSVVTATMTGVDGTVVAAGRRARTTAGADFVLLANVTLTPGGVDGSWAAVATGPVRADAGTLTQIVTPVPGWETITNAADAVLGRARESDDEFRGLYRMRTGRLALNSLVGLRAALTEAQAGRLFADDNRTQATKLVGQFPIYVRHVLVIVESGLKADLERVIEGHRALGSGTMTAIRGGTANLTALQAITAGSLTWDGTAYTGIDLSAATSIADVATLLTTALAGSGVTITAPGGAAFLASFSWMPDLTPNFGTSALTQALGLDPANATYPEGPFLRSTKRALTVAFNLETRAGFPADGLAQVRNNLLAVANGYPLGDQVWANDLLAAAERVAGTRVTGFSVRHEGSNVSGQATPTDTQWTLALADIAITVL